MNVRISPIQAIRDFIKLESAGGIILVLMALIALILNNSPLQRYYESIINWPMSVHLGWLQLSKPLVVWINDGLMAIFFLLVGAEIKREILEGELNSLSKIALPGIAAVGGVVVPALIYLAFNHNNTQAISGWAIPTATDIAFALGILSLLGKRIPIALKIFLTAIAIFDDLAAIIIIALFYSQGISLMMLSLAGVCLLVLFTLNYLKVYRLSPYLIIGLVLWFFVLKSGVHATLAGVALAMAIPLQTPHVEQSPLRALEEHLHPWVVFGVLPIFAFANAGVSFSGLHWNHLFGPLSLGIAAGLFIGKQLGIFSASWIAIKLRWAEKPSGANWVGIYGVALLCGVGFTMSLFIGTLAFAHASTVHAALVRFGVLTGSVISGICGYVLLRMAYKKEQH